MRAPIRLTAAALTVVCLVPAGAGAQSIDGRASIAVAGTVSQFIADGPYPTSLSGRTVSTTAAPSVVLIFETPRTTSTLSESCGLSVPIEAPTGYSSFAVTNLFAYGIRRDLDESDALSLSLGATEVPANSLVVAQDPSQTNLAAMPSTAQAVLTFSATEGIARQVTPTVTVTQTAGITYGYVIDPLIVHPRTTSVSVGLTASRQFFRDTASASVGTSYSSFTASAGMDGSVAQPYDVVATSVGGTWGHELSDTLRSMVSVGAVRTVGTGPAFVGGAQYAPTASASLVYSFDYAAATLSVAHQQALNVAIGTNDFTDQVALRLTMPIQSAGLVASGSAGYAHTIPLAGTQAVAAAPDAWIGDLGLHYVPPALPIVTAGVRGQLARDVSRDPSEPSDTRWSVSVSLMFSYPNAAAARRPPGMSPISNGFPGAGPMAVQPPAEPASAPQAR